MGSVAPFFFVSFLLGTAWEIFVLDLPLKNTSFFLLFLLRKRRTKDAPLLLFSEEGEEEEEEHHRRRAVVPLRSGISLPSRGF